MIETTFLLTASGFEWTPEIFYGVAAIVQLVVILVGFRILSLPAEYNNFVGAVLVVVPAGLLAYFMRDMGLMGALLPSVGFFALLTLITRGDVLKSGLVWLFVLTVYWGMAAFILPRAPDLYVDDLGGIPQMLVEGGFEAEPMTAEDLEALSGR